MRDPDSPRRGKQPTLPRRGYKARVGRRGGGKQVERLAAICASGIHDLLTQDFDDPHRGQVAAPSTILGSSGLYLLISQLLNADT